MLLTKYVSEEFYDRTRQGHFRFGTLSEYRSLEFGHESRFSDEAEGVFQHVVIGDVVGKSFATPNGIFENCSFIGASRASVSISEVWDAWIFCCSVGDYSTEHHLDMQRSNNRDLTHYVTLESRAFGCAMYAMVRTGLCSGTFVWGRSVSYSIEKQVSTSVEDIARRSRNNVLPPDEYESMFLNATYTKPREFQHEREYRFSIMANCSRPPDVGPIYVKDLSASLVEKFASSIISSGRIE